MKIEQVAVMRPLLPSANKIQKYLEQIDKNRWYSNFGPLLSSLEKRFSDFFGLGEGNVVVLANGTAALTNTIRAMNLPRGSICLVPSWTFAATPASAIASGLSPYFVDIDSASFTTTPDILKKELKKIKEKVSLAIVVAPFGYPLDIKEWEDFKRETGVEIIIDAAASFDAFSIVPSAKPSSIPVMISLHATKPLGAGEGGIVLSSDKALVERVRQMSNFGFSPERDIIVPGTNGKMNEYNAAVAHAALDNWSSKRTMWRRTIDYYIDTISKADVRHFMSPLWVSSTCNIMADTMDADYIMQKLASRGVETRKWWGYGCHNYTAYRNCHRGDLKVTNDLAKKLLGIPLSVDMLKEEVDFVVSELVDLVGKLPPKAKNRKEALVKA